MRGYVQTSPTPLRSVCKGVSDLFFDAVAFLKTKHMIRAAEFLLEVVARLKVTAT